jgi:hypothetical protein
MISKRPGHIVRPFLAAREHRTMVLLASAALALVGCGVPGVNRVPLVRVRGVVTFDGKPLAKAVIIFESPDGSFSYAQTSSRGRYDLWFDAQTRGVTPGKKTVRISMNRRLRGLNSHDEGGPGDRAGGAFRKQSPEKIPARYNVHSTLTVDVTADTRTFNFDLKS